MKSSRTRRIAAVLLAGALVATACSDDDSGDGGSADEQTDTTPAATTADTTAAASDTTAAATDTTAADDSEATTAPAPATGEPIKVMATGPVESPVFSLPSIPVGAQIAVDEINAAGGIGGRPLELVTCNDEANPNTATECIQQAADEGVVALVGGLSLFEPNLLPLLEAQSIPWIGLSSGAVFSAPNLFPIADGVTAFAGIGAASAAQDCTNPAIIVSAQATPANMPAIKAGIEASGMTVAAELQGNGGDFAPIVESAIGAGADCIASGVSPAEIGPLLAAVAGRMPVATVDGSLPEVLLQGLGAAADGVVAVSGFVPPGNGNDKVDALLDASKAVAPDVSLDQFWYTGYASVYVVAEALRDADEVSAAAVLAGIPTISGYDTGLGPVLDFSRQNGIAGYDSIYNPNIYLVKAAGGAWTLLDPEPVDMSAAIEALGA